MLFLSSHIKIYTYTDAITLVLPHSRYADPVTKGTTPGFKSADT